MFCPKCGSEKDPFVKGFCLKCYIEEHPLVEVPPRIDVETCKNCGNIRVKGKWTEFYPAVLEEAVQSKLKTRELKVPRVHVHFSKESKGIARADIEVVGALDDELVELHAQTGVKKTQVLCDDCMKVSSDYHEAILQVRFTSSEKALRYQVKRLVEDHMRALKRVEPLAEIIGFVLKPTGFDVLIGSKRAGKETASFLAKKFNKKVVFSSTLVGITRTGKQKKRYTFLVRVD